MDLGLKGKRAIVTGGTRGIGRAIVDVLIAEGAEVHFCARKQAEVDALAASHPSLHGAVVDVADQSSYLAWLGGAVQAMGGLDIFIPNVSGGAQPGDAGWESAYQVDLMASVRGAEGVLAPLAQSGAGSIVAIASIAGLEAYGGGPSPYATMKAGLIAYASQLGEMAAPHNIRVNAVSPGPIHVDDGFWGQIKASQPDAYEATAARHPMGRLGTAIEVARAVVFLASPAASWITRTNVIVDGGFTKRVQF